ncbi:ribonuclease D [Pelagibius litoralis]|uniref:Ribonuclease D n=1 Tax=Pelagibius litoralis TaxID=374515 RepID=A0A967KA47_9PROT|nr:ribonuclease D [Pelagibius litoralis]NIA70272.1 ribonuclease D [Pelagibius litoralis]
MTLIAETAELEALCGRLADADFITVDTEFLRDSTYWPKLCLLQVAGPQDVAAIDTLAPNLDLSPLLALFDDPRLMKVLHSARQDMEIFFHLNGRLPAPVFDTQVAAMVCGFGESVGYDTLVRKMTGAHVDKSSRFTDWSRRPLAERQLTYALADVTHLRKIYEKLERRLAKSGRAAWLEEEMAILTSPETYRLEPELAWRRLKTRSNDRRYLAVLRALATWREHEAQQRNVPRGRVLRDEQLFDIAAHRPATEEELARSRGLNKDMARGRLGKAILEAVGQGLALPDKDLPRPPAKQSAPNGAGPLMDLLKVLLKLRCDEHDVAQKLIASSSDLEQIAADDEADVLALKGWRYDLFGRDALALKRGSVALSAAGNKVRIVSVKEPQEAD